MVGEPCIWHLEEELRLVIESGQACFMLGILVELRGNAGAIRMVTGVYCVLSVCSVYMPALAEAPSALPFSYVFLFLFEALSFT